MDLREMVTCKVCDGTGYREVDNPIDTPDSELMCPACDGVGYVKRKEYPHWEPSAEDRCPKCDSILELRIVMEDGHEVVDAERCPNRCYGKWWGAD